MSGRKRIKRFSKTNRRRLSLVFVFVIICFAVLCIRLVFLEVTRGETYEKKVLTMLNYNSDIIPYQRGDITDRNGTVLATSENIYNLVLDAYVVNYSTNENTRQYVIDALVRYFDMDADEVAEKLDENPENRYIVLKKGMDYEQRREYDNFMNSEEEEDLKISKVIGNTIWFEEEYKRTYPFSTLACDVLGFESADDTANYGLENSYNSVLSGTDGRRYGYINDEVSMQTETRLPQNGSTVVSTLDVNIQRITEKYLNNFMEDIGAENIAAIVMNPNNGEILAMASAPVFDCNNPHDTTVAMSASEIKAWLEKKNSEGSGKWTESDLIMNIWRNFCVNDSYEPGSTAKTMTVSYALDQDVVKERDTFDCDGGQTYAGDGTYVSCNSYHGMLNLQETIMYSCNDAMMQISDLMGKESFLNMQKLFGLGQLTGIDLPGEISCRSYVYNEETMGPIELWTSSFGQGYNATAVQIASAFSSIVNGGKYYQPHIVKEIRDDSGSTLQVFDKVLQRTTVSRATSDWMKEALYQTVEQGSGTPAKVPGYKVGGKTGTSEVGVRGSDDRLVSFIGAAPIDDPQIVVYVIVDRAHMDDQGQSSFASTICGSIMSEVLPYMQIFQTEEITQEELDTFAALRERDIRRENATVSDEEEEAADDEAQAADENVDEAGDGEDIVSDENTGDEEVYDEAGDGGGDEEVYDEAEGGGDGDGEVSDEAVDGENGEDVNEEGEDAW